MRKIEYSPEDVKTTLYWSRIGFSVRKGMEAHVVSGQLTINPTIAKEYAALRRDPTVSIEKVQELRKTRRPWGNASEHCLVEVPRVRVLGKWLGLGERLLSDAELGAILHNNDKKGEIEVTGEAEKAGESPLEAYMLHRQKNNRILRYLGFSKRIRGLAYAYGGHAAQLFETERILDKKRLIQEDWAYLIIHYVDDCSVGSNWVKPMQEDKQGKQTNIIDYRAEENKTKPSYRQISEEIGKQLEGHSVFSGMNNHDVMALLSHRIEQRLAEEIKIRSGISLNPLEIPELVDKEIQQDIAKVLTSKKR